MLEAFKELSEKYETLAGLWGERFKINGAVVLERGTLHFKKTNRAWLFLWSLPGENPVPLTSASVEARLDAAHALPDLKRELERAVIRREGDIDEAIEILKTLIGEAP